LYTLADYRFRELVTSDPDESAYEAARKLESQHVGCVLVTSGKNILGIATRSDFVRNIIVAGKDPKKTKVREIMHSSPISIEPRVTPIEALQQMIKSKVERLVVRSKERIFGVISIEDLVSTLENDSIRGIPRDRYDQVTDMIRKLTPRLLARYEGEERIELERDLNSEIKALLRLLQEVEVSLRP
jgi:signal-transduction protein with cAMP-binding, CBS, and nucleotidyltransferase domain